MKSLVHIALGAIGMAMVFSPAQAIPPQPVEIRVVRAFPDELIREVVVREIIRERCSAGVDLKQLNDVLRSRAKSGEAGAGNDASQPESGALAQQAIARSGDAILGQVIDIDALCSTVNLTANNQVSDSTAETGDAEASNRIQPQPDFSIPYGPPPTSTATGTSSPQEEQEEMIESE